MLAFFTFYVIIRAHKLISCFTRGIAMRIGVIGLSFALRAGHEPNPCNENLVPETERVVALLRAEGHEVMTSSQWEIALRLNAEQVNLICVVTKHRDGVSYLDSDEVILQSVEAFEARGGVDEVVIVANPFIHLQGARSKAKGFGLKVRKVPISDGLASTRSRISGRRGVPSGPWSTPSAECSLAGLVRSSTMLGRRVSSRDIGGFLFKKVFLDKYLLISYITIHI